MCLWWGGEDRVGRQSWGFQAGCCTQEYKDLCATRLRWGGWTKEPPFVLLFQVGSRPVCGYSRKELVKIIL